MHTENTEITINLTLQELGSILQVLGQLPTESGHTLCLQICDHRQRIK